MVLLCLLTAIDADVGGPRTAAGVDTSSSGVDVPTPDDDDTYDEHRHAEPRRQRRGSEHQVIRSDREQDETRHARRTSITRTPRTLCRRQPQAVRGRGR